MPHQSHRPRGSVLAVFAAVAVFAAALVSGRAEAGDFHPAARDGRATNGLPAQFAQRGRVCCQRGRRNSFTDRRECRRSGGRVVPDSFCRPQRTCHQRGTSRRFNHVRGRSWPRACQAQQRTCHQRGTSRRFNHVQGRSWPRACQAQQRTCHQRGTSRRFNHVRGRSWPRACGAAGGGGGRPVAKPRAGAPCTGRDRHGVQFKGRTSVDRQGIATCMAGGR